MNPLTTLRKLLNLRKPTEVVIDPILGQLIWDRDTRCWLSEPAPNAGFVFALERDRRDVNPPEACLKVAHQVLLDPERLRFLLRSVLSAEAEGKTEDIRRSAQTLKVTRIVLRVWETGSVGGEMWLDGKGALFDWYIWHSNGNPIGVAHTEA